MADEKKYSYSKDLWDGSVIVYARFDEGKKTLSEAQKLFDARSSAEGDYSKKIMSLATKPTASTESRTIGGAWASMKAFHDSVHKAHSVMSIQVNKEIAAEMTLHRKEMQKTKDQYAASIANLNKELEKGKSAVTKAKTTYHQKSEAAETAMLNYEKAQQDPTINAKNLNKLNSVSKKAQKEAETANTTYQTQLQDFQNFQVKYEDAMRTILDDFQSLEERRTVHITDMFNKFLTYHEKLLGELQDAHKQLEASVQQMKGLQDVQEFINEKKTGQQPAKPAEYEPYKWKHSHLDNTKGKKVKSKKGKPLRSSTATSPVAASPAAASPQAETPTSGRGAQAARSTPSVAAASPRASPAGDSGHVKAKALFDYQAAESNELSFDIGDIITVTKQDASGWWEGSCKGRTGMFPGNYVEVIESAEAAPAAAPPAAAEPTVKKCRALFEFNAENEDELTIKEGQIVTILSEAEGWYCGQNDDGKSGLFPANYVEII